MNTENKTTEHPVISWLRQEYLGGGISKAEATRELGISRRTLNALLDGNYSGDTAKQLAKLEEQRARLAGQTRRNGVDLEHIETPMMKRIHRAADAAKATHMLVTLSGKSQIGKTTAVEAYKAKYPDTTVLVRMPAAPTVTKLVNAIATAAGIARGRTASETLEKLKGYLGKRHIVIIDEAHLALTKMSGLDALDVLRELFDTCKCAVMLCVTDIGEQIMRHGPHAARLEQLFRRGETEKMPAQPIVTDARAIWEAYGLPEPDPATQKAVGALIRVGCFGQYTRRLRYASAAARIAGKPITWEDFIAVANHFAEHSNN